MNPKVDDFLSNAKKWQKEMELLRQTILDCNLTEEYKWGKPCYTYQNNNIVLIHGFKDYCALLFMKGVLLNDSENILIQQTENVQAARQLRFKNLAEISGQSKIIKAYVFEAIEVEKAGLKVKMKKTKDYEVPQELIDKMQEDKKYKTAFESLTAGRKRAYYLYFSNAKQAKTRIARIEKSFPQILKGKGYNER